nr:cache domain-containing protein [Angustibacter aerolatus]
MSSPASPTWCAPPSTRRARPDRRAPTWASRPPRPGCSSRPPSRLVGAGYVAAPGVLADAPYRLEWWTADPDAPTGPVEPLAVQTDPQADDFRDYTALPWYAGPAADHRPHLTGPYVDYLCTDEYTLTFTRPVLAGGRFVGVVGADLYVRTLEALVQPVLAGLARPATLLGATGRVVTSSAGWVTGDLLRDVDPGALLRCSTVPLAVLLD